MTSILPRFRLAVSAVLLAAVLAACQNSEVRAEEHYQNALELLEEGDLDRATVEFRNVFQLDGNHTEARRTYASALRDAGRLQEAYGQYLRLVEQLPDDAEGRIALAEMAIETGNWEEAERHGRRAIALVPEDPRVRIIGISLDYAAAAQAEDAPARRAVADAAEELSAEMPDNLMLNRILIDAALRDGDFDAALVGIEEALAGAPDSRPLHDLKLSILAEQQRTDEVEAQLLDMIDRFPQDETLVGGLVRFYVSTGDTEAAGAFLRARAEAGTEQSQDYAMALVQLSLQTEGPEAARAQIARLSETMPDSLIFGVLDATIRFDMGETAEAVAALEALIESSEPGSVRNDARITLARMLIATGNPVGAQRLVGEVLEADSTHIDALKLRATRQIETDDTDGAIATLRTALDQDPQDAEAMTLMARAHERNGNRDLARDFLGLAADASGNAPGETLRYVNFLVEERRYLLAEEALIRALRLSPGSPELLIPLGEIYVAMEDWPRAEQVERTLSDLDDEGARRAAAGLAAARLSGQGRTSDAAEVLEQLASENDNDIGAAIAVMRARLAAGETEAARSYARELLESDPENPALMLVLGMTEAAAGDSEAAVTAFRDLTETHPQFERGWIELVRSLNAQGETEEAEATLGQALAVLPDGVNLLWAEAGFQERAGNIDVAIEIYEQLYERLPNSDVVANNLASLVSTWRDDDESLERAWQISRRLRGTEVPAFADTYGWIAFRRGDLEQALTHLELAAEGLPEDPLVQYHYGKALDADGQEEAALERFRLAVEAAGEEDTRPQIVEARAEIERLSAAPESGEGAGDGE